MSLTAEDILSALVGRSVWPDLSAGNNQNNATIRRYAGVLPDLEAELVRLNGGKRLSPSARARSRATADGRQSRPKSKGGSLHETAAELVAGMPDIEWAAILWVIDDDRPSYKSLYGKLHSYANHSVKVDRFWPATVRRARSKEGRAPAEDYTLDLIHLALLELQSPGRYSTHGSRADWFGLSQQHWRRIMDRPYGVLQSRTFTWFGGGCGHIAKRINQRRKRTSTV